MNAIVKAGASAFAGNALMPTDMRSAMDLATMMAKAKSGPIPPSREGRRLSACDRAGHAVGHVAIRRGAIDQRHPGEAHV